MNTLTQYMKDLNKLSETSISIEALQDHSNLIKKTIINSDRYIDRVRIIFKNNHELSIIRGFGTHGQNSGLFEIMLMTCPIQLSDKYADPIGYCSVHDLNVHILYIGTLPTYINNKEIQND